MTTQRSEKRSQAPRPRGQNPEGGSGGRRGFWPFGFPRGTELSRRTAAVLLAVLVLVWLVAGSYLVLVSQTAIAARRIQAMRDELALLQKENAVLEQQLAEYLTLDRLHQAAEAMGFMPAERVEFVEP